MPLPLSDAKTTFMPELHPATVPIKVAMYCAWCTIRLIAVPDDPVPHNGVLYHPSCWDARRRGGFL